MSTIRHSTYCKYYSSQLGGEIPIFRGGQHGAGLGDILRGILRFIAPVALRGISSFANSALQAREGGASFKDAARGAIAPSLSAMADSIRSGGGGYRQAGGAMFRGEQGVPFANAIAYKSTRKRPASEAGHSGKKKKARRTSKKKKASKKSRTGSKRKQVHHESADAEPYNF